MFPQFKAVPASRRRSRPQISPSMVQPGHDSLTSPIRVQTLIQMPNPKIHYQDVTPLSFKPPTSYSEIIDEFIMLCARDDLVQALPNFLTKQLQLSKIIIWRYIKSNNTLYSVENNTFKDITNQNTTINDIKIGDTNIYITLNSAMGYMYACVEATKESGVSQEDLNFIEFFQHKFTVFSPYIIKERSTDSLIQNLALLNNVANYQSELIKLISDFFKCRTFEIWRSNGTQLCTNLLDSNHTILPLNQIGIVGKYILKNQPTIVLNTTDADGYNASFDGIQKESILIHMINEENVDFRISLVLRGPNIFLNEDQAILKSLTPIIMSSYIAYRRLLDSTRLSSDLFKIIECVDSIVCYLNPEDLAEAIMNRMKVLMGCEKCTLYLINSSGTKFITDFQPSVSEDSELPIHQGFSGRVFSEKKLINIKSMMAIPLYDASGGTIGILEVSNKTEGIFLSNDERLLTLISPFIGQSLDNSRQFRDSQESTKRLHSFLNSSLCLTNNENIKTLIKDIIHNAKTVLGADSASIHVLDESINKMVAIHTEGENTIKSIPIEQGLVRILMKTKAPVVSNDYQHDERKLDPSLNPNIVINSIALIPFFSPNKEIIGVLTMIVNDPKRKFTSNEITLMTGLASFLSISIVSSQLQDFEHDDVGVEMEKYLTTDLRGVTNQIPSSLEVKGQLSTVIETLAFNALECDDMSLLKIIFHAFDRFNLFKTFQIHNETFFRFIFEIREQYNSVPYHNWTHAVDVAQYMMYQICVANLDSIFSSIEILAMMVAAICHDANHYGFNNVYNVKTETPLGILFKEQSVMETHHCSVSIAVLSRDECNIFSILHNKDLTKIWSNIIHMILATDMAFHFKLVNDTSEKLDAGEFSFENPECRTRVMQLLLKVSDISNVSRPFAIADKWCDVLCEEFFRQGDSEVELGIGLTSPLNDRQNSNKPKSQIGFYNFICLPLFQIMARIFPPLQVNVDSVKSNLEVWKSMTE